MSVKLSLDRDFTRFLCDPTFPHQVTVCIGEEQLNCSGAVLAQQSSVLERKFREDNGVLMFEEFIDFAGSCGSIFKCIQYLHGADLEFDVETLAVVIKFASLYEVEDLFQQALIWLVNYLKTSKSAKTAVQFLKVANDLSDDHSSRIKREVGQFIQANSIVFENDCDDILETGLTGPVMIFLCKQIPANIGGLLIKWAALSNGNKDFIMKNHSKINYPVVFSRAEQFTLFVDSLSSGALSNDSLRTLLDLQRSYFLPNTQCDGGKNVASVKQETPCTSTTDSQIANRSAPVNEPVVAKQVNEVPAETYYYDLHDLNDNQIFINNLPPYSEINRLREILQIQGEFRNDSNPIEHIHIDHRTQEDSYAVVTCKSHEVAVYLLQFHSYRPFYSKTPIYRASRGQGFRPGISGGPVNRIEKCTNLHINPVFGGRGKAPVNRGTRYIGAR